MARLESLDRDGDACGSYFLGHLSRDRKDPGAADLFRRAAERATREGHLPLATRARLFSGEALQKQGDVHRALTELAIARITAHRLGETRVESYALEWTLQIRRALGEDLTSIEAETFATIERLDALPLQKALLLSLVANTRFRLGRYAEADEAWQQSRQILLDAGHPESALVDEYNRSLLWLTRQHADSTRARAALEAVFERSAELDHNEVRARALIRLGALAADAEGERLVRQSLDLGRNLVPEVQLEGWLELATILSTYRPEDARSALDSAMALRAEGSTRSTDALTWEARMRVAWATLDPEAATAESLRALDDLEALIDQQLTSGGRGELFAVWTQAYDWLAGRLFVHATGETEVVALADLDRLGASGGSLAGRSWVVLDEAALAQAFSVLERRRARLLLEALHDKRHVLSPEHRGVLDAMVEVNLRLLASDLAADDRQGLETRLAKLERQEAELNRHAETLAPTTTPSFDFVDLDAARATLADDEALLVYQLAPWTDVYRRFAGGSWLLAIHRGGTSLHALPDPRPLASGIELFVGLLPARDGGESIPASSLGERLLGAALGSLPEAVDHLVLIPDGALHCLPFGALVTDAASEGSEPIGLRFRLSRQPSATVWQRWRSTEFPPPSRPALVFADPEPATGSQGTATDRSWSLRADGFGRLPGAAAEGRAISRRLGRQTVLRLDREASEASLRALDPGRFAIVHLAAHAVVDGRTGRRSGVVLAPGSDRDDGLLQPPEIAALDLDGRLVVLSACHSASGRVLRGEGPLSLARAFHQAGSPAVVAGLWRLRDDDTRDFFDAFYDALADGADVSTAGRSARRRLAAAGAPAHAWAGVTVIGDGAHRPFPDGHRGFRVNGSPGVFFLVVVIAGLLGGWIARRRFR